jgi:hypothetical protein
MMQDTTRKYSGHANLTLCVQDLNILYTADQLMVASKREL